MNSLVALITGAARGIGLATSKLLLAEGWHVVMVDRDEEALHLQVDQLENATALVCDVSNPKAVSTLFDSVAQQYGHLNALVNNAGVADFGPLVETDFARWRRVMATNLDGVFLCSQAAINLLKIGGGCIVNIGAVVGFRGFPGDSAYAASKAGLAGLTRALSIELAKRDIRVNLVIPGLVLTEMTSALSDKALESMRQKIPMGRYGDPDEIAEVVEWVARSRYMTGAFVPVDGGLMSSFGVAG